ncbi:hypothetical protein ACOALA_14115 [Alicyclobacillus acidoterrestris]|uniref:Uncharacterized protein n=1 Tax=Alicyclobacillus acidoterrestris (strain ATCC 49025 / DSM 3922 / CIP 106132 / NCIMB 13137 / GD3B) TaxID=1356854 RepID=A0A9E6ZU12_ALIAG|nr:MULTISPECIES: hypothetical protein [Alicyclobacillus]UNO50465.1 hypothetical protein K1I37_08380 [Alicyclobacillus acidoterrestris]
MQIKYSEEPRGHCSSIISSTGTRISDLTVVNGEGDLNKTKKQNIRLIAEKRDERLCIKLHNCAFPVCYLLHIAATGSLLK